MIWLRWLRKKARIYVVWLVLLFSFNLYFVCLMKMTQTKYLLYLDLLLLVFLAVIEGIAFFDFWKKERRKAVFLRENDLIYDTLSRPEDREIFEHDLLIWERCVQKKFEENCDLQDYVTKWCHEFKIPLSAALLIAVQIKDADVRTAMKEQLERMNWQMSMMMQGCRLQSPLFDLQMRQVSLKKCVRAAIKNNQFFLIQNKFQIDMKLENMMVYTDEVWLTYILDQMINNAIKYARPEVKHNIQFWAEKSPKQTTFYQTRGSQILFFVEDNGEGIKESDIRRIFEKGYTGSNYHNGKYKSTGMGLYMADKIAENLAHKISVESCYGAYTRFCIAMCEGTADR